MTVAAGQTQADFTINTQTVTSQFHLNIFAHVPAIQGNTGTSALLLITPGGGPLSLKFVTVTPDAITGGNNATGTVTLSGAAPSGGAVVTLTKSFSDGSPGTVPITIPASVTVPAGQATASFPVSSSNVTATVTVTRARQRSMAQQPFNTSLLFPLLSGVQFEGTVPGGQPATGTVFLNGGAPSGGVVVSLASLNTSLVTVPANVTVPAGQTSVNFTANTFPVSQFTFARIRATAAGRTVDSGLFLSVSLAPTSVTFTPSTIVGPGTVTGRVTLASASPGNSIVDLVSSNPVLATVPFSVIVPQGQTSATFPVNVAQVTATTTVQISATFDNVTRSGTLTINPPGRRRRTNALRGLAQSNQRRGRQFLDRHRDAERRGAKWRRRGLAIRELDRNESCLQACGACGRHERELHRHDHVGHDRDNVHDLGGVRRRHADGLAHGESATTPAPSAPTLSLRPTRRSTFRNQCSSTGTT